MNYKVIILLLLCGIRFLSPAQSLEQRKDWYFGKKASVHFDAQNNISFNDINPRTYNSRFATAHFMNGQIALITDGAEVFDKSFNSKARPINANNVRQVQVFPHTSNDSLFHVFSLIAGQVYHFIYNGVNESVIKKPEIITENAGGSFAAIKHCYALGYWVVVPLHTNQWQSFYVSGNHIQTGSISGKVLGNPNLYFKMVGNFRGNRIGVTLYADTGYAITYDFDNKCGLVSNPQRLPVTTQQAEWNYPIGIAFSPNDQFVFVCYSVRESALVQYNAQNLQQYVVIAETKDEYNQFNDLVMGPDGKAYVNRHINGIPSRKLSRIDVPNSWGANAQFRDHPLNLKTGTNGGFLLPAFVDASQSSYCNHSPREFRDIVDGTACLGNTLSLITLYPSNTYSNIQWIVNYNGNKSNHSGKNLEIVLDEEGVLEVQKVKFFCNFSDTIDYSFVISNPPNYALTSDTTICYGDSVFIQVSTDADEIVWSTGQTDDKIWVSPSTYTVQLKKGECQVEDSVAVSEFEPLSILLKDQFYICERENELVKLDAGKGFVNYLWHPTQDTTQWIIVNKIGDYYVLVEDFRGCKGDKGTEVAQRCDLIFFIPNAVGGLHGGTQENFRVIGDGIEKVEMQIFNRWGEKIFEGDGIQGWDPNSFPEGVYLYTVKVTGYKSKQKVYQYRSGTVTVLK